MKFVQLKNGLREAYLDADQHKWKKEELIAYDNASIAEQDEKGKLTAAKKKGKEERDIELVIKLDKKGKSPEEISDTLDMEIERVRQIIENQSNK